MNVPMLFDQQKLTTALQIQDVVLKTSWEQWMTERVEKSELAAQLDDESNQ